MVDKRPRADSVNNALSHQHPEQTPSSTHIVTSTWGSPCHQRRLEQTPLSATLSQHAQSTAPLGIARVINVAWSGVHRQHAQSIAPLGAAPIINITWDGPPSISLGVDSVI